MGLHTYKCRYILDEIQAFSSNLTDTIGAIYIGCSKAIKRVIFHSLSLDEIANLLFYLNFNILVFSFREWAERPSCTITRIYKNIGLNILYKNYDK